MPASPSATTSRELAPPLAFHACGVHDGGMRAIVFDRFGGPEVLTVASDAPEPEPTPEEVLVQVTHVGLNPLDHKIRDGSSRLASQLELPAGTGREMAGTVISGGADLDDSELGSRGLAPGTRVFGMRPPGDLRGTAAEVIAIAADALSPVPTEVMHEELPRWAGLALVGLTAISAVDDAARVCAGDTVLIHGGTGGVGQLLIPMALEAGASQVWATGRAANAQRIRELGATPIAYDEEDWEKVIEEATEGRGVDVVLDTHYHSTFLPSLDHIAPGGRVVPLPTLADLTPATERGITAVIPEITVTRERLDRLVIGLREGHYPLEVSHVLPLEQISRAHELLEGGHTRGKIVLDLDA